MTGKTPLETVWPSAVSEPPPNLGPEARAQEDTDPPTPHVHTLEVDANLFGVRGEKLFLKCLALLTSGHVLAIMPSKEKLRTNAPETGTEDAGTSVGVTRLPPIVRAKRLRKKPKGQQGNWPKVGFLSAPHFAGRPSRPNLGWTRKQTPRTLESHEMALELVPGLKIGGNGPGPRPGPIPILSATISGRKTVKNQYV